MKVLTTPHVVLRQKAKFVEKFDDDLKKLVIDMTKTMFSEKGVGLAAPQVGVSLRVIVVSSKTGCFVNPRITETSNELSSLKEGCLSIPARQVVIQRPSKINVEYQDLSGEKHQQWFSGLESRIIQHEIDHLDGILMTDRAKKAT